MLNDRNIMKHAFLTIRLGRIWDFGNAKIDERSRLRANGSVRCRYLVVKDCTQAIAGKTFSHLLSRGKRAVVHH